MNNRRGRYYQLTTPADTLLNRRDRHKEQKVKVFFIEEHGAKVGITKFAFTPKRNAMKVNLLMSPYTDNGRSIYKRTTGKREALERPNFFQEEIPFYQLNNRYPIYNFEFYLNREYAFNRDRGKCNCCKVQLNEWNLNTHHKTLNYRLIKSIR